MLKISDISDISNIADMSEVNLIHCIHVGDVRDESNYIAFDLLLRYFTSLTSPTCIALILCDYID